ncbi:RsmD family RNA methyltransferase [Enterococcus sp. 8G7_MSG3316]|uniref:RsmD family RNA methyltransferase n=1 Tax=Candidatus Enterococcus testudinis TaxID=1834191 RepID=A0A242A5H9_9ENTE|nr:16S rRNA (guanine(966)-N(2))-methyltransferase RsmD [Enterococcus sp. 8G7_MSG3316]OTN76296.1 RsmD family RNA methyltransferase [Enterococcus sp. 8G7_MSG3316]
MRIVAGEFGGRKLKSLAGDNTRPTTDKVKGAIFNMLGQYLPGGRVLDLFSGSGGLAIEAVSRGADHAVCVDRSFPAINIIRENIAVTKQPEKFTVLKMDAKHAIAKFTDEAQCFDYLFLDPPYAKQQIVDQLTEMLSADLLSKGAKVICETDISIHLPEQIASLVQIKQQTYGISQVTIYRNEE